MSEKKYSVVEVLILVIIAILVTIGFSVTLVTINSGTSHGSGIHGALFVLKNLTTRMNGFVPYLSAILWSVVCLSHVHEFYIKWKSSELTASRLVLYGVVTIVVGVLLHWFCVTTTRSIEYLS